MLNRIIVALTLLGITFTSSAWGQLSSNTKTRSLPDFDIREAGIAPKPDNAQIQAGALVEARRSSLASFQSLPDEVRLGTRIVPNQYGLPKVYLREGHSLSAPSQQKPADIAKDFLRAQPGIFFLDASEIDGLRVLVDDATDTSRFLAFNQTVGGIDVFNGQIKFTLNKDGELIQVTTGDLVPGLNLPTMPRLSAEDAVKAAFARIGSALSGDLSHSPNADGKVAFVNPRGSAFNAITAELSVFPMTASSARLAYRIFLEADTQSWYEILIDADTGDLLFRHNLYVFSEQANIWTESPTVGARMLATLPDGWFPANGTVTTGNNVDAYLSTGSKDLPDNTTDPNMKSGRAYSATQDFDFQFGDGTVQANPRLFQAAAVTNLFYLINTAHDYYYSLGFNEAAGNFQTDNLGRGGVGNDAVLAEAQFGGFTNNAAFGPTPEGIAPKIRMGLFTRGTSALTDDLDSDYDGQVVVHEYGHGVSNRLVGAKVSTSCLARIQSGAMGEGWSDYFAISFFNDPVMGSYISQNMKTGVRRFSYEGYPMTYEDIGNGGNGYEVHDDGEVWAGTLWDLRKSLGQSVTDRLVVDGLKSTPCNPSMTDARDAILSADQAGNNGSNRKVIWTIFARHGLGYSALGVEGTVLSGTRYDAAYDMPPDLQSAPNPAITSNPLLLHTGAGDLYQYTVTASNPAGGTLNYTLSSGPAGMTLDPVKGLVTWSAAFVTPRVKITVTDGSGGKIVHGYALPVLTNLRSGNVVSIGGAVNSAGYALIGVPSGTPVLQLTLRGGSGDPDLFLFGPDGSEYYSVDDGSTETISLANPRSGIWELAVVGYAAYSQVSLTGILITPTLLSANATSSPLSGDFTSETFFKVSVPAGASSFVAKTTGGIGDVDLFLRKGFPAVCPILAFAPCSEDSYSATNGNEEAISVNNPAAGDWYLDLAAYEAYSGVTLSITTTFPPLTVTSGGAVRTATPGTGNSLASGYATASVNNGTGPFGTAVFSLTQNGYVVSEAGVPASPPTQSARIFIDYRTGIVAGAGTISISTGLAIANTSTSTVALNYTLRDSNAQTIATGHGSLLPGAHQSKFIQELKDIALDFSLPANFSTTTLYGSLEIASSQPVSITALRLTTNQRGDTLLTSTSIADLSHAPGNSAVYFPQLADGGGFTTSIALSNTSGSVEAGTIAIFDDNGDPLSVRPAGGTAGATFSYSIPASGFFVFQTDGSPASTRVGWVRITPNSGNSPVGAGVFSYSLQGILVTESGIPSAVPTTTARLYVDKSNFHDTGLAIANPASTATTITVKAFQTDGLTSAGNGPAILNVAANGHKAAFAGEIIAGLPNGFTGVAELSSSSPFAVLTLRSLSNGRDLLLTTFPVADATQPAPSPIVFPQIADGGGFTTQFIFISASGAASVTLNFFGDDGTPLTIARTP